MARVRRSDPAGDGVTRVRRGSGFSYHDVDGSRIDDEHALERIRALAIPPAWREVWICADDCGHIQATGVDAAGRKQYLYHEDWRRRRDREKFKRLIEFGQALPPVRRRLATDLAVPRLVRKRVLSCSLRLLDIGLFRVGGEAYAEENESFGLATIRKRHVRVSKGAIVFEYPAKSGVQRTQVVEDPMVLPTVLALRRRKAPRNAELLAYHEGRGGGWRDVRSVDINEHLKEVVGPDYSAKDFRTWNATVLCAQALAMAAEAEDRTRAVAEAIERTAEVLGNTAAVCRDSYIDPRVIERYEKGQTIAAELARLAESGGRRRFADRQRIEAAVMELLA